MNPTLSDLALRVVAVAGGSLSLRGIIDALKGQHRKASYHVGAAVFDCVWNEFLLPQNNSSNTFEQIMDITDKGRQRLAELECEGKS